MSKGGKGGGGGKAPAQIKIPQSLTNDIQRLEQLGTYEATNLNLPYDIGNYYMSLATGGFGPEATSPQWAKNAQGIIGPAVTPTTQYGPGGGPGGGLVTDTNVAAPPKGHKVEANGSVVLADGKPYSVGGKQVFFQKGKGYFTKTPTPGTTVGGTTYPATNNPWLQQFEQGLQQEYGAASQIPGIQAETQAWENQVNAQIPGATNWMNELYGQIPGQQAFLNQQEAQIPGAQKFLGGQEQFLNQMETGQLMPGQQAEITSAVNSGTAAINQELANAGLGKSTMGAELGSEIGLQGAATAGQLMQGNVQAATGGVNAATGALATQFGGVGTATQALAESTGAAQNQAQILQSFQKLALGGQELQMGEESQLYSQFQGIANQSFDAQQTLFQQAMAGYGMEGQFLNQVLAPYGMSITGTTAVLQAETAQANNLAQLEQAQMSAQSAQAGQMSGLFQGLGSLLGGSGGLSSLLGGGAGAASVASSGIGVTGTLGAGGIDAAVGATAGGAAGGGSAIGGLITGLISLISAF